MLKVECESCKAPYQVDERRVPASGLKMRCPKCGHSFIVKNDGGTATVSPAQEAPKGAPRIVPRAAPAKPNLDMDLPAVPSASSRGADLPSPVSRGGGADLPALPNRGGADLPSPVSRGADLPAVARGGADLPAPVNRGPTVQKRAASVAAPPLPDPDLPMPAARAKPGAAPAKPGSLDFELDLPAVGPPRPKGPQIRPKSLPAPDADLPALAGDLPAPKAPPVPKRNTLDYGDLPARMDVGLPAPVTAGLPAPIKPGLPGPKRTTKPGTGNAFGEIDLPSVQNELPSVQNNLPMATAADQHLPSAVRDDRHLPASITDDRHMPAPITDDRHLPMSNSLPPAFGGLGDDFGELELPRPPQAGGAASAPSVPPFGSPSFPSAPPQAASPFGSMPPAAPDLGGGGGFGELELPVSPGGEADPFGGPSISDRPPARPAAGGMAFGEVDLGGDDGASGDPFGEVSLGAGSVVAARPSAPADPFDIGSGSVPPPAIAHAPAPPAGMGGGEATLDAPAKARRERPVEEARKPSKAPKILGALLGVLVMGGAALYLTPYGPFGYYAITDQMHASDYARAADDAVGIANTKLAADVYPDAIAANDEIAALRAAKQRARSLTAFAAFSEMSSQLRFGKDSERATKAKLWLTTEVMKDGATIKYLDAAQAAQAAVDDDLEKARGLLESAAAKYGADPIAQDIACARGEVELDAKNAPAATAAFKAALALAPNARAHFGLARAAFLARDYKTAKTELEETLKASPKHGGATLMRAQLTWAQARDDDASTSALKDLASVTEGDLKTSLSPFETSEAQAERGWIMLLKGRSAEARAAFDTAVKLDARNISALVGQGEVLYQEGRYTEALTRFDTAVQTDATNVNALVGDAKTKIALERLADAKAQLTAARARFPQSMLVARWIGAAEAALGNKKEAEAAFTMAIGLVDPADPDAMQPYAAYAGFLAAQGRAAEAAAKLEEARKKLPDSAMLQRTLGDVSVAQGQYDDAVSHFKAALQKDPEDTSTKFKLGQTLRRMNKIDDARATFDSVATADKDYPGLSLERGLLYEQAGDVPKALEMFKAALDKTPNDADSQLRVGAAYVVVGKPEEALALLKKVREQRPNSAEVYHYEGRANLLRGPLHEVEAMRSLKKAVDLDPNRAEYHLYVGMAATQSNPPQLGLAKTEIDRALAIDSLLADGYWQRAVIEQKEGAIEDGLRDARKALELKPTRFEAHATMAECFEQRNDPGSALAEWQKAVAGDGKNPYWRYKVGRLLGDRGNLAGAAEHLQFSTIEGGKLQPRPGWLTQAYFLLGDAERKLGKKAEAVEAYQHFLETASSNNPDRRDAIDALRGLGSPWQGSD